MTTTTALVTWQLLRRTRRHVAVVLVLLAWWFFGNLYEAIVTTPQALSLPPGTLPDELGLGSPVFYYVPAAPATLALAWALVARLKRLGAHRRPGNPVRHATTAAVLVSIAAVTTAINIVAINPRFRDASLTVEQLRSTVLLWEASNAVRLLCVAGAAVCLLTWRTAAVDTAVGQPSEPLVAQSRSRKRGDLA